MTNTAAIPTGSSRTMYITPAASSPTTGSVPGDDVATTRAIATAAGAISAAGSPQSRMRSKSVFGSGSGEPV